MNRKLSEVLVYVVCFCLIYLSVFGAETIKSDERSNSYLGHILVILFFTITGRYIALKYEYLKSVLIQIRQWS